VLLTFELFQRQFVDGEGFPDLDAGAHEQADAVGVS
jgi:hypothetical protein